MTTNEITTTPSKELESHTAQSDAGSLTDELGGIGIHTRDDGKLALPVAEISIIDDETVWLWYRYPSGELIPEMFDRPRFWDPRTSKLARVVDHAGYSESTLSQMTSDSDAHVIVEETTIFKDAESLRKLIEYHPSASVESFPTEAEQIRIEDHDVFDTVGLWQSGTIGDYAFDTWRSVDPRELVDDDRYTPHSELRETDGEDNNESLVTPTPFSVDNGFTGYLLTAGFFAYIVVGVLFSIAHNGFSMTGIPNGFVSIVYYSVLVVLGVVLSYRYAAQHTS